MRTQLNIYMMEKIIPHNKVLEFILAGNAEFTVKNDKTGNHRVYKVRKRKEPNTWYVFATSGYVGVINRESYGLLYRGLEEFKQVFKLIVDDKIPDNAKFYHIGKCCVCGRPLKDPESIELGIGPQCRGKR